MEVPIMLPGPTGGSIPAFVCALDTEPAAFILCPE